MGGKHWTEDDEIYLEYLLFSEEESSYIEASLFLNRSVKAITRKAFRMRKFDESIGHMRRNYTESEEKYIRNAYVITSLKVMAEYLDRSPSSLSRKMKSMGLRKNMRLKEYDKKIRDLASKGHYQSEIARKLGLNVKSVHSYTKKHGIECVPAPKEVMQARFRELDKISYLERQYRRKRK